ncbi:MAG TPA: 50S ribosomal protein L11 methyltransferase [Opitutaceae bacterium]|nr:50S ribosomal protein L11 methyltransferase [Opitutaceae bacterium]
MELWEIRVEIPAGAADGAELALLETGNGGWTLLEDAVSARAWVVGIFRSESEARSLWARLRPTLPAGTLGRPRTRRLPDADWADSYRAHFKSWAFGRLHWVPVWERGAFRLPAGHSVLWLDPGMAFGTGSHETTRLCIERLVEFEAGLAGGPAAGGIRVIDAGCGSGILALSAALLGFRDVSGFDADAEAVRVSCENARLNGLSGRVRFSNAALPRGLGRGGAGLVLANLQADVLFRFSRQLAAAVVPGGLLVMSGILAREAAAVRAAFTAAAPGWSFDSRVLGEWCDACLRRPSGRAVRRKGQGSSASGTPPCRPSSPCPR